MSGKSTLGGVHTLTLPSKYKVYVRRPSAFTLIKSGGFPAELASSVWGLFTKKLDMDTFATDPSAMQKYAELIEKFWPFVLVKLQVIPDDQDVENGPDAIDCIVGTCHAGDLDDLDKQELFLYGIGLAKHDAGSAQIASTQEPPTTTPEPKPEEAEVADLSSFRDGAARDDDRPRREPVRTATVEPAGIAADAAAGA